MKAGKDAPKADVSRGLPSVNETRPQSNWKQVSMFVVLVALLGGGAAYWVYLKVKDVGHNMVKKDKPAEEKPAMKSRVFGAPDAGDADGAAGGVPAPKPGEQAQSADAGTAPPVPPPLPKGGASSPSASAEAPVPAIAVTGGPTRPPALNNRSGANPSGQAQAAPRTTATKEEDNRSRYDTPFVVNGAVQPGGRAGASSSLDDTVRAGKEAIAAAMAGTRQPAVGGGGDGGKGALSGMLTPTNAPMVRAGRLGNLSLTVKKGTPAECVLQTRIIVQKPGLVRCSLTSDLISANGKVVLADKGSEVVGEQNGSMRQGDTRVYVLWTEIITKDGVTIPIDSPGTDALGAAGLDGEVDNRWGPRIGASLMLSFIDDAVAYQTAKAGAASGTSTNAALPYQNTQQQGQRIAEKVLDSTINIPPILYKNQGDKVSIIIMRHLDFSSVYSLEAK
jgi:type IV secretion system protein VirB10